MGSSGLPKLRETKAARVCGQNNGEERTTQNNFQRSAHFPFWVSSRMPIGTWMRKLHKDGGKYLKNLDKTALIGLELVPAPSSRLEHLLNQRELV